MSPHSTIKSRAFSTTPKSATAAAAGKKTPRTVHIDVYCTGSEGDDDDDEGDNGDNNLPYDDSFSADSLSPSTSLSSLDLATSAAAAAQLHAYHQHYNNQRRRASAQRVQLHADEEEEAASNSTPQTVFTAQQMRLHHSRRNSRQTLPRRIVNQQQMLQGPEAAAAKEEPQLGQLRQFILAQANETDEINVSKMMLLDKHMGTAGSVESPHRNNHRGQVSPQQPQLQQRRFNYAQYATAATAVEQQPQTPSSDQDYTMGSSAYPDSSPSIHAATDPTWSSLASSSAAAAQLEEFDYFAAGVNGVQRVASTLAPSNLSTADSFEYENHVDRTRIRRAEQQWQTEENRGWRSPEQERKHMLQQKRGAQPQLREEDIGEEHEQRRVVASMDVNRFYMRQNAVDSEAPRTPDEPTPVRQPPPAKLVLDAERLFGIGATAAAAARATRFGDRIATTRQRHFGPAKNPDCQCDHCRLHAAERRAAKQVRGRAASMGDEAMAVALRSTAFWASRQRNN